MSGHIYHGPWINWEHGFLRGATLTLSDRSGGLLTSFIATFVALVAAQLWKILAFAIHQFRSTTEPRDGLYHQQQAVWRNTAGPGGAAWTFAQQVWSWNRKARLAFLRTFPLAIFSIAYLVIFGLAAVFSSEISKAPGQQRLVIGNTCGYWGINQTSPEALNALNAKNTNDSQQAATYARACYGGQPNALQCSRYPKKSLSWNFNSNATCPFQSGMCIYGDTAAFEMTSKLIDTQEDLGINTPKSQRLQFQKRTTCAPVHEHDYVQLSNFSTIDINKVPYNDTWLQLLYGPLQGGKIHLPYTAQVALHGYADGIGYQLSTVQAFSNVTNGTGWAPITQLFREDADMVLMFLRANSMRFRKPVDDPWFAVHYLFSPNETDMEPWWNADQWITTLGCVEQYRVCNPNNNLCTDYLGSLQALDSLIAQTSRSSRINLNNMQSALVMRLIYAATYSTMYQMTYYRGALALRAQETVSELDQAPLPPNQWQIELSSWFDGGLANFQQHILEYALGPHIEEGAILTDYAEVSTIYGMMNSYLCNNQIINDSTNTMSFSIVGMVVLFVLGGFIIITSLVIDRFVGWLQVVFKFNLHGRTAWLLDDKLQLQKVLFERSGMGRWREGDESIVPATTTKDKFTRFSGDSVFSPSSQGPERENFLYDMKTEYVPVPTPDVKYPGYSIREQ